MQIINVIAILASPLIALLISKHLQNRQELTNRKLAIFYALISTRHNTISDEQVRAFNSIDVVFSKDEMIRTKWKEYYDILKQNNRMADWEIKKLELLKAMADVIGYKKSVDHLDLSRIYTPTGILSDRAKQQELLEETLRVLKSSQGIQFIPSAPPESESKKMVSM